MHKTYSPLNKVAIVIPVYKNKLEPLEELALEQCLRILNNYKIFVIKPESLDLTVLKPYSALDYVSFSDRYFESRQGYNELMLWDGFYEQFLDYQYILIHQLDAFVFEDNLEEWCDKGFDYIGAPWLRENKYIDVFKAVKSIVLSALHTWFNIKQPNTDLPTEIQFENKVGNGGLSLRRVQKFYKACKKENAALAKYRDRTEHYFNEDVWWGIEVNRKSLALKIPGYKTAVFFSIENHPERAFELTGGALPFGCHAFNVHLDFWKRQLAFESVFRRKGNPKLYVASVNPDLQPPLDVKELKPVPKAV